MSAAMPLGLAPNIFWPVAAGLGTAALMLSVPLFARRRQQRLAELRGGATQRYFEERRELEGYGGDADTGISAATVGQAILAGLWVGGGAALVFNLPEALMPLVNLIFAVMVLPITAVQGWRTWREAQPDPRGMIMSPARHDTTARAERRKLAGKIAGTLATAVVPVFLAWLMLRDTDAMFAALESLW
ncbi:hypothetical protein [Stakelama tenebrarum]|uniref:Uncharacterized protein n=1 Tax=Stakelama tenebrarum TaxID=2711215 RepID=A0A6G6Y2Z1_9SPHN|nr:hypothetical protein [Sphingosinithalassobacter tenebrarum]QIG78973.1 hypothetical protein G5C33_03680 [Sphingosinithalassobacter tenebrarum]